MKSSQVLLDPSGLVRRLEFQGAFDMSLLDRPTLPLLTFEVDSASLQHTRRRALPTSFVSISAALPPQTLRGSSWFRAWIMVQTL